MLHRRKKQASLTGQEVTAGTNLSSSALRHQERIKRCQLALKKLADNKRTYTEEYKQLEDEIAHRQRLLQKLISQ